MHCILSGSVCSVGVWRGVTGVWVCFHHDMGRIEDHFGSDRLSASDRSICCASSLRVLAMQPTVSVCSWRQPSTRFIAHAKHTVIFTFKLFEVPKAAAQWKDVALDVLGMQGALEVANPLFEYEICFGVGMRAEALAHGVLRAFSRACDGRLSRRHP